MHFKYCVWILQYKITTRIYIKKNKYLIMYWLLAAGFQSTPSTKATHFFPFLKKIKNKHFLVEKETLHDIVYKNSLQRPYFDYCSINLLRLHFVSFPFPFQFGDFKEEEQTCICTMRGCRHRWRRRRRKRRNRLLML